jgi:benzoyl-CoA reductase/2-hydroxyglutaryl-CoA dehydratase subunit BcrC/BadD/HgdB
MRRERDAKSSKKAPSFQRVLGVLHQLHARRFERDGAAWDLLFQEITRQGVWAFERKAPVVWTTSYVFPMEMIAGLGLIPVDFELYAGLMSSAKLAPATLRAADRVSLPQDSCTVHRMAVGASVLDLLPRPDILVSTTHYCDGKARTNEFMAQRYGTEYLLLDMPFEETPAARTYLESQLRQVFRRLCEVAGREADESVLKSSIRHFNEMTRHLRRLNDMRAESPSPLIQDNRGVTFGFMTTLLYGTPHAAEVYRRLAEQSSRDREGGTIPPESLRFLWLMASPSFETPIFSLLEERGGRIVAEELSHCYWMDLDERTPIRSMARRMLSNSFMGPVERRAQTAVALARRYRVDAALHFGHLPCRQANGALQVVKDRLEAAGFRFINLEADLNDPTNFPTERIQDQLLTHLDVLRSRVKR